MTMQPRSLRPVLLIAALGVNLVVNTGCDQQQAMAALGAVAKAASSMTANGSTPTAGTMVGTGTGSLVNGASGLTGTPSSSIGPIATVPPQGLPTTKDGSVQIPSYGPNASKAEIGTMLDAAAAKYGIPPDILKAVAYQESGWRADAKSFDGGHGKGVMQIDDRYHAFARTNDVWDPAKNIDYGARYLRGLYDETGDWSAALKRYNGGSSYPPKVIALSNSKPWSSFA